MDADAPATRRDLEATRRDLEAGLDRLGSALRAEMSEGNDQLRAEMREGNDRLRAEMREGNDRLRGEFQAGFAGVDERLRGLEHEMKALDVRLHAAIADSANRVLAAVDRRMGQQMATWAHTIIDTVTDRILGLDDRDRDLPGRVSQLEVRVDRIEHERGGGSG
jgi:hypothetical protein